MTRRAHVPDDATLRQVEMLSGVGIPQEQIARAIGISPMTLRKRYREQLDAGAMKANAKVAQSLFRMATEGRNVAAAIFWMKARCGWREKYEIESSSDGKLTITVKRPESRKELDA